MPDTIAAVRTALAVYLRAHLTPSFPALVVSDEWPDPAKPLPDFAVTVLVSGTNDEETWPVEALSSTPSSDTTCTVLACWGRVEIGLQLDAWASFAHDRDRLVSALRAALNRPAADTLGVASDAPSFGVAPGLVLRIPGLFNVPAEFVFTNTPALPESSDDAQSATWRATFSGTCTVPLVVQREGMPLRNPVQFSIP